MSSSINTKHLQNKYTKIFRNPQGAPLQLQNPVQLSPNNMYAGHKTLAVLGQ